MFEYREPYITADAVLALFIEKRGLSMQMVHGNLNKTYPEPNIIFALKMLEKDDYLERSSNGLYNIEGHAAVFHQNGGYKKRLELDKAEYDNKIAFTAATLKANESVEKTNAFQRKFGWWSLVLTIVSIVFIGVSAWLQYQDNTDTEVQRLKQSLQRSSNKLDSIVLSLKEINQSIQKANSDSAKR